MTNFLGLSTSYIYIIVMVAVFGLMIAMTIIPQRKQKKQQAEMMSSLSAGDKIMTIGGMVGTIVAVDTVNNQITVNVGSEASPVNIVIIKNAIRTKLSGTGAAPASEVQKVSEPEAKDELSASEEKTVEVKTKAKKKTESAEEKKDDLTF